MWEKKAVAHTQAHTHTPIHTGKLTYTPVHTHLHPFGI